MSLIQFISTTIAIAQKCCKTVMRSILPSRACLPVIVKTQTILPHHDMIPTPPNWDILPPIRQTHNFRFIAQPQTHHCSSLPFRPPRRQKPLGMKLTVVPTSHSLHEFPTRINNLLLSLDLALMIRSRHPLPTALCPLEHHLRRFSSLFRIPPPPVASNGN